MSYQETRAGIPPNVWHNLISPNYVSRGNPAPKLPTLIFTSSNKRSKLPDIAVNFTKLKHIPMS